MDAIDERLDTARSRLEADPRLAAAARELMTARVRDQRRRRRIAIPAISLGVAAVFAGGAAWAASAWGPWIISDPDLVVSRTWYDVDGQRLGYCESRLEAIDVPTEGSRALLEALAAIDVSALAPDPGIVAELLAAQGRSDDFERLLPAEQRDDAPHEWARIDVPSGPLSDARILQEGLLSSVSVATLERAFEHEPKERSGQGSLIMLPYIATQCEER